MTFWAKSLRVFNCLWENGTQSVRRIAHKTGLSKSSVHRLTQAMERRGRHPEAWVWGKEGGRRGVTRPVGAPRYTVCLKSGGGGGTLSEGFARPRVERRGGGWP